MNYGMFRVAAASLKLKVANPEYNKEEIIYAIDTALKEDIRLLVTPELSITGYTCADLFFQNPCKPPRKMRLAQLSHIRKKTSAL